MGQCGCSDTLPDVQFPGPDGLTYAIQIYPSCHYCSSPVGIDVYRFTPDEAAEWLHGVEQAPFWSYSPDDPGNAQFSIPVIDPEEIAKAFNEAAEVDERPRMHEQDVRFALPSAVQETLSSWSQRVEGS